MQEKNIFDRLVALPELNFFEPFYKNHKEVLLYLFLRDDFYNQHGILCFL